MDVAVEGPHDAVSLVEDVGAPLGEANFEVGAGQPPAALDEPALLEAGE